MISGAACMAVPAQEPARPDNTRAIQGSWALDLRDGSRRIKFIADGQWAITQADPETGAVIYHHGGTYTLDGSTYVEKVVFANPSTAALVGREHKFEVIVEGDTIHQKGIGNPWTEDWKRIKP